MLTLAVCRGSGPEAEQQVAWPFFMQEIARLACVPSGLCTSARCIRCSWKPQRAETEKRRGYGRKR